MGSIPKPERARGLDVCRTGQVPLGIDHAICSLRSYHVLDSATCRQLVEAAEHAAVRCAGARWSSEC